MQPLLSAIMIVKNEEKNLPRVLKSLQGVCDEICIVDTGSTDRSIEIAKEMGAKISFFPWNGNESDARNASVKMAEGRWLFTVDADEEISLELAEELKQKLSMIDTECGIQSLSLIWRNHYEDGTTSLTRITRITRNFPDFKFEGKIHPTANYRSPNLSLEGYLEHYGYIWTPEQKKKKSAHMLEHLAPYIKGDHPDFARLCQYVTYLMVGEKRDEFSQRLQQIRSYPSEKRLSEPYWRQTLANILLHFSEQNDFSSGIFFAEEIISNHPDFVSALFYLLQESVQRRDWNKTEFYSEKILQAFKKPVEVANIVFPEIQKPAAQAWQWLAKINLQKTSPHLPDDLIQTRILHILLHSYQTFKFSCDDASLAKLFKIYSTLSEQKNLPELNLIKIIEAVHDAKNSAQSPYHLLASLILIEVFQRMGKMRESLTVLSETLNMYPNHRWLALACQNDSQSFDIRFFEKFLHQP